MSWAESEKLAEWMEKAYQNGAEMERRRIIELLEANRDRAMDVKELDIATNLNYFIALLKKEK